MTFKDRLRASLKTRPRPARSDAAAPTAKQPQAPAAPTPATAAPVPTSATLTAGVAAATSDPERAARREGLAAEFDAIQLDLGGLVYEMAIRDHFRLDVLSQRAAKLQAVDAELARAEGRPVPIASAGNCPSCSTPLVAGAAFCAGCGRALTASAPAMGSVGTAPVPPAGVPASLPTTSSTPVSVRGTALGQPTPSPTPGAQAGGAT